LPATFGKVLANTPILFTTRGWQQLLGAMAPDVDRRMMGALQQAGLE
jgi:hypothetical protein